MAMLLLPVLAKAQFSISGTVSEKSNKTLSGASVRLKNKATGMTTDGEGKYRFNNLKAGNYILSTSYIGYQTIEKSIKLSSDEVVDFTLTLSTFLADEVIVRATRANEKSATTYKNIDKAEIERNNFGQDLPFILSNTPGVVVTSDAGAGVGYTGIRIRGSDASRVNVTINGIPYNDSESQGIFWVNMPDFASSVDNIQIQRGVGTSTNGAGAFGGSLNIQTSAPSEIAYAELNNTFGSFNTLKNTVKLGTGLIDNKWSFDGRLSRVISDGFVDRGASNLKSYFLSGAYYGKTDLLRINVFSGTEKTYQAWNGVPEAKLRGDLEGLKQHYENNLGYLYNTTADSLNLFNSDNRKYNQFLYKDQNDNYAQNHYQALYAKQFSEKLSFNGALHYTDGKGYFEEYKNAQKFAKYGLPVANVGGVDVTKTDLIRRRWLDNDFYGLTYAFNYNPQSDLNFTLGGAYNQYRGKHFGEIIWAQYASTSTNDYHYYDGKGNKNDFNSYAKVNYSPVTQLSLFADLQYRNVKYDITGMDKNRNPLDFHNNYNFFNPKFGATYFLGEQSNLYASFSVANKEPNRDDFTNLKIGLPVPKPERLNNIEAGYRIKNSDFSAGVNIYGMFYKDQLIFTGEVNDGGDPYRQNVDKSSRMGIELDASYIISPKFAINANAALSRNKIKNYIDYVTEYDANFDFVKVQATNYANPDISFSPNTVLFGELVYKPLAGFAVALQSKYVSKQYMDNTQNENRKLNAYWVNNARLGYDFSLKGIKNINIGLLANNILNKKYESNGYTYSSIYPWGTVTENFYFPQAGTNFLLSLNLKF
ncbi:iron complex outermembrane recepter protein [Pedobacter sp. ok626]|uniref:TonB-dependent receptor n=1 Tax=Pedobacter sp. ok626 TaxID=1761882 RepID=UPI000882B57D|nr:TonB-dependent receptor [Pedobacter sp. ok626]SDL45805.1 iron complex outermembrane recepter protein [Pedobacter sp. ok626]